MRIIKNVLLGLLLGCPAFGENTTSDGDMGIMLEGVSSSNLMVELAIALPEGFGHMGHIEIFCKDDLMSSSNWAEGDSWIPTYGIQSVFWTDPASSNKTQRFYLVTDGVDMDGDGHSDLYEAWVEGTDSNVFNVVNTDGDDLHDWLELKIFGDLSQTGTNDYDLDGLLNGEELVSVSANQPAIMISDPACYDSDNDGLNDFEERREWLTDPMVPDTDSDGRDDASEVLGSPRTDPNNPDTVAPVLVLAGG